jgi:Response regulators consisting of a CheY-like receiver domain and a winged-helix DNA-binding domain
MTNSTSKPVILYAEDDFDDYDAIKEALEQLSRNFTLIHVKNGLEAVEYLKKKEQIPDLLVLDLNMPVMDGKEVLVWVKEEGGIKDIPVMIFTTSSREEDIRLCQKYYCTFFRKPTLYRDLLHIVQTMLQMASQKTITTVIDH